MTVADLMKYLAQKPQDAPVKIWTGNGHWSGNVHGSTDPDPTVDFGVTVHLWGDDDV